MGYEFFFSYKRVADTSYQKRFFDDLSQQIRILREEEKPNAVVGFFDQRNIEQGEEWDSTLATGLQQSNVLVCAYSKKYFQSEYCGKEWQVFQLRREEYRRQKLAEGEPDPPLPIVVKPVLWMPLPEDLDPKFKETQYMWGDPSEVQNLEGLQHVLQFWNKYQTEYMEYVVRLAKEIRAINIKYKLPELPILPDLKNVPSAFVSVTQPAVVVPGNQSTPEPRASSSSKQVKFIFAAAEPAVFAGKRGGEAYRDNGGADWRPFYPQLNRRIGSLVQNIVSDDQLDFDSRELPLNKDLIKEIEQAYDERKVVVIVVDGWTVAYKDEYRKILKEFDEEIKPKYINYSVLVLWNEGDPENDENRKTDIFKKVKQTLSFRAENLSHTIYYHDSINTVEKLRDVLREVLVKIPSVMHTRVEDVNEVPKTIAKPIISSSPGTIATSMN